MQQVQMPGGQIVDMPDTLSPEQATRLKAYRDSSAKAPAETAKAPVTKEAYGMGPLGGALANIGTSMIAKPVSDVAGLAAMGKELVAPTPGGGDPEGFKRHVQEQMTYQPRSELGQAITKYNPMALIGQGVSATGQGVGNMIRSNFPSDVGQGVGNAVQEGINQAPGLVGMRYGAPALKGASGALREAGQGIGSMLRYRPSTASTQAAQSAGRTAAEADAAKLGATAASEATRAGRLQSIATGRAGQLDTARNRPINSSGQPVPDLEQQGVAIRTPALNTLKSADEARSAAAQPAYERSAAEAKAREAGGARVDTAPVEKPLEHLHEIVKDIPGLGDKVGAMIRSIKAEPAPPPVKAPILYSEQGVPLPPSKPPVTAAPQGKEFENLTLASRYLHDVAKGGVKAEGYSSIVTNAAREAAHELDRQLIKFNPSYGAAKSEYAELSQPLNVLSTKYGKLFKTEGGILKDSSDVVSNMDLPARFLSKPEGVATLRNLIGDKATDTAIENWLLERDRPMTASGAKKSLAAPNITPTLNASPGARSALESRLGAQVKTEERVKSATAGATEHGALSSQAKSAQAKIKSGLDEADALLKENSATSKKAAYEILTDRLDTAGRSKLLETDKWKAAHALIDRKQTIDERIALTKKILGVAVAGEVGKALITGRIF